MKETRIEKREWGHSYVFVLIVILLAILVINIVYARTLIRNIDEQDNQITKIVSLISSPSKSTSKTTSGKIIGPQINSDGLTTKLVEWPTISVVPEIKPSEDPYQDAIALIIPTGTPPYGAEVGVSFDDPITAQKRWGQIETLELTSDQQARWQKIISLFTCDYCCGGPGRVTSIKNCGCAHAKAWRGMAKFFIKFYGDKYSDEEIMGEMTRWKGLWYPKGMIDDYLVYVGAVSAANLRHGGSDGIRAQFAGQSGGKSSASASLSGLENLPSMVGGC